VTARALAPAKDDRDVAAVRTGEDRAAVADRVVAASISGGIVNIRRCGMERAASPDESLSLGRCHPI
jgi:hypothetical protein